MLELKINPPGLRSLRKSKLHEFREWGGSKREKLQKMIEVQMHTSLKPRKRNAICKYHNNVALSK